MSDEELNQIDPSEAPTEVPNSGQAASAAAQSKTWQMPEPVFRQTSGYLPQGFEKRFPTHPPAAPSEGDGVSAQPGEASAEVPFDGNITMVNAASARPAAPPPQIQAIEPQPDFPDTLTDFNDTIPQAAAAPSDARKKRSALRTVLILLGVGAVIAFLIVFLIAIYFLFLLPSSEAGNF